jgi:hypothetical protein
MLNAWDPALDYSFWKTITMPDVYEVEWAPGSRAAIRRLWVPAGG